MSGGPIGAYWKKIHRNLEKPFNKFTYGRVLELGAGNGEHFDSVRCGFDEYFMTDLRIDGLLKFNGRNKAIVTEVQDVNQLTYEDEFFDRILITCVLVHLAEPEKALAEMHRVAKKGAHISIYVPCEPGALLRLVRRFSTRLKARKMGIANISTLHFQEHRTYFLAIDQFIRDEFRNCNIRRAAYPFRFLSWNFNLYKIYQIEVN